MTGVCGGEIEFGVGERWIVFLRLFKIFDRDVELGVLISLDALIKLVASAELIAADSCDDRGQNNSRKKHEVGLPLHPALLQSVAAPERYELKRLQRSSID